MGKDSVSVTLLAAQLERILEKQDKHDEKLDIIKEQTIKTNGRVTNLEVQMDKVQKDKDVLFHRVREVESFKHSLENEEKSAEKKAHLDEEQRRWWATHRREFTIGLIGALAGIVGTILTLVLPRLLA